MEEKTSGETMLNGDAEAGTALDQPRREWAAPQFERIPLSEAMGPGINFSLTDGASLYS